MAQYRKKPVVIEAFRFNVDAAPKWAMRSDAIVFRGVEVFIQTLEGDMRVNDGDWVIKGVQGELYPCKPDIFTATYDPVE